MDYGKLAYVKVEELENVLHKLLVKTDEPISNATVNPMHDFYCGEYYLGEINGAGTVSITVKLTLRLDEDATNEKVKLLINGLDAGDALLSGKQGEKLERVIIASVYLDGALSLALSCSHRPSVLISAQTVVQGGKATISGYLGKMSVDGKNGVWAIATCENDEVGVRFVDESNPIFSDKTFLSIGKKCDVCALEDGYLFAYVDNYDNAFIIKTDNSGQSSNSLFVSPNCSDVALHAYNGVVTLALLSDGKVKTCVVRKDGISQTSETNDFAIAKIKGITFVKGSSQPMLVVQTNDRSYLWLSTESASETGERISLNVTVSAMGVES